MLCEKVALSLWLKPAVELVKSTVEVSDGSVLEVEVAGVVTEDSGARSTSLVDMEVVELELESLLVCRSRNVRKKEAANSYITVALVGEVVLEEKHRKFHKFL